MPKILRPMLASNDVVEDYDALTYPLIASPKLDGWRSFNVDGVPRTRSGKTIPNIHTRSVLSRPEFEGLDGELICGSPTDPNSMQLAQSAFSTHSGEPDFTWHIFDDWQRGKEGFWDAWVHRLNPSRLARLPSFIKLLPQTIAHSSRALDEYASCLLAEGYEGVITRTPNSPYKHNRSTRKQEWMLKLKPYVYEEGRVIGFKERMENRNPMQLDELGYTRRSSAQIGKRGANTLGSFTISCLSYPSPFDIGCGHLTAPKKQRIWLKRDSYLNSLITFKHFAQSGVKDKPRHGQFVSFRASEDLG